MFWDIPGWSGTVPGCSVFLVLLTSLESMIHLIAPTRRKFDV